MYGVVWNDILYFTSLHLVIVKKHNSIKNPPTSFDYNNSFCFIDSAN